MAEWARKQLTFSLAAVFGVKVKSVPPSYPPRLAGLHPELYTVASATSLDLPGVLDTEMAKECCTHQSEGRVEKLVPTVF